MTPDEMRAALAEHNRLRTAHQSAQLYSPRWYEIGDQIKRLDRAVAAKGYEFVPGWNGDRRQWSIQPAGTICP